MDVPQANEIVEEKTIVSDYGNCNMKVIVRVRPANETETYTNYKRVVTVVDDHVIVFDPKKETLSGRKRRRSILARQPKDLRLAFDRVFDQYATQVDVFEASTKPLVDGIMNGINCSVFAYGATGAGKTYTMLGNPDNPGVTFLTMMELFKRISQVKDEKICNVSVSYLEIYNERVKDLIKPSGSLDVRVDTCNGVTVNGLSWHEPQTASELFELLECGNKNRIQFATDINANSSRSHAVFQVVVEQRPRSADFSAVITRSKMLMVDLAGSERALVTTNRGMRLKEGANINRSLLALGNCINALSSATDKQAVNVTYRNSKLTRLLKDSLGGNCHTVMIVNVSPSSLSYEETFNSLKYADRAKHIKTKLVKNVVNVDFHLSNYREIVKQLQKEVSELKEKLTATQGNNEEFDYSVAARIEGEANSIFDERSRLCKEMTEQDASEQDAKYKIRCRQRDVDHRKLLKASQGRTSKLEAKILSLQKFLNRTELNRQSINHLLLRNNKELNKLQMDINSVTMENPRSAATKKFLDKVVEHKKLQSECCQQRRQLKYYHKLVREHEKEAQKTERILHLALEVVAETRPTSGKAKENYNALMRLVEGEKEVAWAEHSNSVILPQIIAPHLVDDAESNISPAFLQSSGILACHITALGTAHLNEVSQIPTIIGNDDGNGDESSADDLLNSTYPKKVSIDVTESSDNSEITSTNINNTLCLHDGKNVTAYWAERTPVTMAIDEERKNMATPLAHTVTKLPKSPHPRTLRAAQENTQVISPYVSPHLPSSLATKKHCVGMATNKSSNMAATPKSMHKPDHKNVVDKHTPGSKRPFVNLPPIFAPTVIKARSGSPDEASPCNSQSQTTELDCTTPNMGFEDNFVPFNAHSNKSLTPNQTEHDATYYIDKESSISLNQTYTRALNELEEEDCIVGTRDPKAAAKKVGQEIWQKVKNIDNLPDQRPAKSHPLSNFQCESEHVKKIPGYLCMTKSAAIKRLPSTRQPPLLRSNKENIPGGRKRTNTTKQANRTVRPLARSASLKSRPITYNW